MSSLSVSSPSIFRGLILYGSQTGNAEEIAKSIRDEWREKCSGHPAVIDFFSMNDYVAKDKELEGLRSYSVVSLICSTTGNGDQPDNAIRFFRALKKRKLDKSFLSGVRVSILGLGDSNYDKFNESGRVLDQLCQQVGAQMVTPKALADDGLGLEIVVEPFKKKFLEYVTKLHKEQSSPATHPMPAPTSPAKESRTVDAEITPKSNNDAKASGNKAEEKSPVDAAALALDESERRANDVIDSEKKIRLKIDQPAFMARIPKCGSTIKFHSSSTSGTPFLTSRFQRIDSEAELRGYTPEAPSLAALSAARFLTTAAAHSAPHNRMVIHLELQLPLASPALRINFSPGDSIGIYVANDELLVDQIIQRLGFKGDEVVSMQRKEKKINGNESTAKEEIKNAEKEANVAAAEVSVKGAHSHLVSGATLRDLFLHCVDVTAPPKKAFLRMLAEYCDNEKEKAALYQLLSRDGFKDYSDLVFTQQANLLDVLELYPSCRPALAHLLDQLPPLLPRYYSITNSPLLTPAAIQIAFSVVQHRSDVRTSAGHVTTKVRRGVSTAHLWKLATAAGLLPKTALDDIPVSESLCSNNSVMPLPCTIRSADGRLSVPIFLRRAVDFTLPEELDRPLILIGPGTGVCPFRSFLQHRRQQCQAIASSGGRTSGWWRGLEMELGEEKEEEEESPLKITNPRLPQQTHINSHTHANPHTAMPNTNQSAVSLLTVSGGNNSNVSRSHSSPQLASAHSLAPSSLAYPAEIPSSYRVRNSGDVFESRTANLDQRFGATYLFFGCRDRHVDFLYADDWQQFLDDRTLTGFFPAFSREQQNKNYVTHAMNTHGAMLADLLLHDGILYVCGDGATMAKDVQRCLEDIIAKHENGRLKQANFLDAAQFIAHIMKNEKRYRQDIWS